MINALHSQNNTADFPSNLDEDYFHRFVASGCVSDTGEETLIFKQKDKQYYVRLASIKNMKDDFPAWSAELPLSPYWLAISLLHASLLKNGTPRSIQTQADHIIKFLFLLAQKYEEAWHVALKKANSIGHPEPTLAAKTKVKQTNLIQKKDLPELFQFLMMHTSVETGKPKRIIYPLSFSTVIESGPDIKAWHRVFSEVGMNIFTTPYSYDAQVKAAKVALSQATENTLNFSQWREGLSFDTLGLDYGKYYSEHCNDFFKKHSAIACSINLTLAEVESMASHIGFRFSNSTISLASSLLMQGSKAVIPDSYLKSFGKDKFDSLKNQLLDSFKIHYASLNTSDRMLSSEIIKMLAEEAGIADASENQLTAVKTVVEIMLTSIDPKHNLIGNHDETLTVFENWINQVASEQIDTNKLRDLIRNKYEAIYSLASSPSDIEEYCALAGVEQGKRSFLQSFLNLTRDAGATSVVQFTGWRSSEFGWGLDDLSISINEDPIDQKNHPLRYHVKWLVPKTNGGTKLNREVISPIWLIAQRTALLNNASTNKPSLYTTTSSAKDPHFSNSFISRSVYGLWSNFVNHYPDFVVLKNSRELRRLQSKKHNELDSEDKVKIDKLLKDLIGENPEKLESDFLLVEAYEKAQAEHSRVRFFLDGSGRKKLLDRYINTHNLNNNGGLIPACNTTESYLNAGILPLSTMSLIEEYVSDETRELILTNGSKSNGRVLAKQVVYEIVAGCKIPSPHSFRHMWAEAVYRRFDGDAGYLIRSNFKHISDAMWLAYINNKDNAKVILRAKREIASPLLANYLKRAGKGYAGKLNVLLRRLAKKTKALTNKDAERIAALFSKDRVKDIKSHTWGTCIVLTTSLHSRCGKNGVPARENACPSLCLGCGNNLTQSGNIDGILVGIANDLNVLQMPRVPAPLLNPSIETVKNALTHLKKLNVDTDILSHIQSIYDKRVQA